MFIVVMDLNEGDREICINSDAILFVRRLPPQAGEAPGSEGALIELTHGEPIRPKGGYAAIVGRLEALGLKTKPGRGAVTITPMR